MELEIMMLSKVSQLRKSDITYFHSYVDSSPKKGNDKKGSLRGVLKEREGQNSGEGAGEYVQSILYPCIKIEQ
jgi:hypothetical protein